MALRLIFGLTFLLISFFVAIYFNPLLHQLVILMKTGWVFGSIFIRLIIVIFFIFSLNLFFSLFPRTKNIKYGVVVLIGLIPGFLISFITPIYNTDYGNFSDDAKLETTLLLEFELAPEYNSTGNYHIAAFFDTSCGHCKQTSRKLGTNLLAGQKVPVHAFFVDSRENVDDFIQQNNGSNFTTHLVKNELIFMNSSGFELPSVYLIDKDGRTLKHWAGDVLNYTSLDYLLDLDPE